MAIELYDYEAAACPTKVRWALAEERLPWVRYRVDLTEFEHKSASYVAMYPQGLVPAAKFDGNLVTDADEIMMHIAASTATRLLNPAGERYDAALRYWLSRIRDVHRGYGMLLYAEVFLPLQARRTAARRIDALANIADPELRARTANLIENGLPQPLLNKALSSLQAVYAEADNELRNNKWLAGDQFSIADIGLYPYVNSPIHRATDMWFGKLRNLQAWLKRMQARDAYSKAVLDYPYEVELSDAVGLAPGGGGFRRV